MAQSVAALEEALLEAKAIIEKQKAALDAISQPPFVYGTVVSVVPWTSWDGQKVESLQLVVGSSLMVVQGMPGEKFIPGETVLVHQASGAIAGRVQGSVPSIIGTVIRKLDDSYTEVEVGGMNQLLLHGLLSDLKPGDSVLVDRAGVSILRLLSEGTNRFDFSAPTHVSWDMIGGLEEAKKQMIEAIELPRQNPEIFSFYNIPPCSGILLYGPPGCGKTMLGKAAATSIGSAGFLYIKGPEILERYVGVAEATIRNVFASARQFQAKNGVPAVLFIDEADAILSKRGTGISADLEKTIVPTFLSEMDGLSKDGTLVILTTNRADKLDPAIIRDGRIDKKIQVTRPQQPDVFSITERLFKEAPLRKGLSPAGLADLASRELFSKERILYLLHEETGHAHAFTLSHIVNGAMAHAVVTHAKTLAMRRDLAAKKKNGIEECDVVSAISLIESQNRALEQEDGIEEFVESLNRKIARIQRFSLEEYRARTEEAEA